jgi:hypothetical protein
LLDANLWVRGTDYPTHPPGADRKKIPIEDKESLRWLESYRHACKLAQNCPETKVIYIADRECDIIEVLEEAVNDKKITKNVDVIIRAQHNRQLDENDLINKKYKNLIKAIEESNPIGEAKFKIASTHEEEPREVIQKIKAAKFKFKRKEYNGGIIRDVSINVVMAIEENPPPDKSAIKWVLLTTMSIDSYENVMKIFQYYTCRWEIEIFIKILKSGCKVEERQLKTVDRLKPLIALFLILSWRIQYVMMLGRVCPEIPCNAVFEDFEWKPVFKVSHPSLEIPKDPPSLYELIIMIAKLGGYLPGPKAGPPGVKVMWRGMSRMAEFTIAWLAFGEKPAII